MLTGGIYFGEKTIWDGILENMRMTGLWSDDEIDSMKCKTKKEEPQNDLESLVESLMNYKDVLEGKVRDLEQENEELRAEIERQDELIERLEKNDGSVMYNQLLENTEGEARELFVRHCFYSLKCVPINPKCDCENLKKQIEELQGEVRDLTAENVKIGARNENLKKLLETSIEERDNLKNALRVKEYGNVLGDKVFKELKEKYETADLEREHLAKELDRLRELVKELNERHQQDCIDLNKKQAAINELVDSYSELRRMKGLSE